MLPHPTTSSFPSAIPAKNSGRPVESWKRVGLTGPSGLQPFRIARDERVDARGELAPFGWFERRGALRNRITLYNAEILQGGLVARDDWNERLARALEGASRLKLLDRIVVTRHQLEIAGSANPPSALPFTGQHVGRAGHYSIRHRSLRDIAVPSMAQRARESVRWREQIEDQVRVAR